MPTGERRSTGSVPVCRPAPAAPCSRAAAPRVAPGSQLDRSDPRPRRLPASRPQRDADPSTCTLVHLVSRLNLHPDAGGLLDRSRSRTCGHTQSDATPAAGAAAPTADEAGGWDADDRRHLSHDRTDVRPARPGAGSGAGTGQVPETSGRTQRLMLRAIGQYQQAFAGRPSPCRFTPSCSEYSREAIETFGAGRGGWLTVRRLLRCRPFGPSGFDPVPERSDVPQASASADAHLTHHVRPLPDWSTDR